MKKTFAVLLCLLLVGGLIARAEETWTCPACNKDALGNFCPWCGAQKPPSEVACPGCGATWAADAGYAFCPSCGTPLAPTAETEAPADPAPEAPAEPITLGQEERVSLFREAVFGTGQMIADAIAMGGALGDHNMLARFKAVDFGNPLAMALIQVTQEQLQDLCAALQCDSSRLAKALNQAVNTQYSVPYANAAGQLVYAHAPSRRLALDSEDCVAALLVYEKDISLVLVNGEDEQGLFLISDASVLAGFDAAYISQTLASLGLVGARYSVYANADELAPLKAVDRESFSRADYYRSDFTSSLTASDEGLLHLLPQLYACGLLEPDYIAPVASERYLYKRRDTPEQLLAACRFISGPFDSAVELLDPTGKKWHERQTFSGGSADWSEAPDLSRPEDFSVLADNPLQPGDKVLALFVNTHNDGQVAIPSSIQCAIPEASIPETPGDADYYLLVYTQYVEDSVKNGITVYNAESDILLYDAETNAPVCYIDHQTDVLEGFGNVATSDKFYVSVRFHRIVEKLNAKRLFG